MSEGYTRLEIRREEVLLILTYFLLLIAGFFLGNFYGTAPFVNGELTVGRAIELGQGVVGIGSVLVIVAAILTRIFVVDPLIDRTSVEYTIEDLDSSSGSGGLQDAVDDAVESTLQELGYSSGTEGGRKMTESDSNNGN